MKRYILLLTLLCIGCGMPQTKIEGVAMGMRYQVLIKEKTNQKPIQEAVDTLFYEIDNTLNHWNENSEISKWNNSETLEKVSISPLLSNALNIAKDVHEKTNGLYDPTLGLAIKQWKKVLPLGVWLSDNEIKSLKENCGWDRITLTKSTLQKHSPKVQIDLDGITKGLFCDLLSKKLSKLGFSDFLIEWAGEVKLVGGPFKIQIQNEVKELSNISVATSGAKFQAYNVTRNGCDKIYSHFISKETFSPLRIDELQKEESVYHHSCAYADGFATAYFLQTSS